MAGGGGATAAVGVLLLLILLLLFFLFVCLFFGLPDVRLNLIEQSRSTDISKW